MNSPRKQESLSNPGSVAPNLFLLLFVIVAVAGTVAASLIHFLPLRQGNSHSPIPPVAFVASTGLLGAISVLLVAAIQSVRRERQRPFRRHLLQALVAAGTFVGVQAWGLSALRLSPDASDDVAGVNAFLFVFAILHALHVSAGILFLALVNVRAQRDRYDHEYYWGVRYCSWYWHALGGAWLVILGVFGLAGLFLSR